MKDEAVKKKQAVIADFCRVGRKFMAFAAAAQGAEHDSMTDSQVLTCMAIIVDAMYENMRGTPVDRGTLVRRHML